MLTLAMTAPALYTDFLRILERIAADAFNYNAATFGNMLKALGCPLFVAGHAAICLKKPALEVPDICYMSACSALSLAFKGAYCKKPLPEAVFVSALLFFGAYVPLRWRLLAAKASPLIPTLGVGAAVTLTLVGITQLAIKYGCIEKAPDGPTTMAQAGTFAGTLLGVANCIKLLQLIQQGASRDNVYAGQVLKVVASMTCFTGNTLGLGWQEKAIPSNSIWRLQAAVVVAQILKNKGSKGFSELPSATRGKATLARVHNGAGFSFPKAYYGC